MPRQAAIEYVDDWGHQIRRSLVDRADSLGQWLALEPPQTQRLVFGGNAATTDEAQSKSFAAIKLQLAQLPFAPIRQMARTRLHCDPFVQMLHMAILEGDSESLRRLQPVVDALAENERQQSVLVSAVLGKQPMAMLHALLRFAPFRNAINRSDEQGRTPLHYGAAMGRSNVVKLLLKHGANPGLRDHAGSLPLELAARVAGGHVSLNEQRESMLAFRSLLENVGDRDDLRNCDRLGRGVLHWVALHKRLDLLSLLMQSRFLAHLSMTDADVHGSTALHLVVQTRTSATNNLDGPQADSEENDDDSIARPANVSDDDLAFAAFGQSASRDEDGAAPLFATMSAAEGAPGSAGRSAEKKRIWAGAESLTTGAATAAAQSASFRPRKMVALLVDASPTLLALQDDEGKTAMHVAALANASASVAALVPWLAVRMHEAHLINIKDRSGKTALHYAALAGHTAALLALMANGADDHLEDAHGATALHYMCSKNHAHCISSFFDWARQAQRQVAYLADRQGRYPLVWAVLRGNVQTCRILLENGVPTDRRDLQGGTALHAAAFSGQTMCIHLQLCRRADVDARDADGCTALVRAVQRGHVETAVALQQKGASLQTCDAQGRSVLHYAAASGQLPICSWLLSCGLDVNYVDATLQTPVHAAIQSQNWDIAKLFVDGGADLNATATGGVTPLMLASQHAEATGIVEFLIAQGARINAMDRSPAHRTALDYAELNGAPSVIALLRQAGAWRGDEILLYAVRLLQRVWRGSRVRHRFAQELAACRVRAAAWVGAMPARVAPRSAMAVAPFPRRHRGKYVAGIPRFVQVAACVVIQQAWRASAARRMRSAAAAAARVPKCPTSGTPLELATDASGQTFSGDFLNASLDSVTKGYLDLEKQGS